MRTNRVCLICQTPYYYCPHCDESHANGQDKETWRILVHDQNCRTILNTLQRHSTHEMPDEEAADILKTCDLSVLKEATEAVQKQVKDILATQAIKKPTPKKSVTKKANNEN